MPTILNIVLKIITFYFVYHAENKFTQAITSLYYHQEGQIIAGLAEYTTMAQSVQWQENGYVSMHMHFSVNIKLFLFY